MEIINKLICPETEDVIKSHWKYSDKVYISCVCIAYNHEIYIRDAIDSILAQKSEYRFELIIHDDKSTDRTREIILEYKKKFPSIIKLILQDENQYSKCERIISLTVPYLSGEYITICEGDDFWIDNKKLQQQIELLIKNKNINICISKAMSLHPDNSIKKFCDLGDKMKIITFNKCILGPQKDFYPTATFFLRKTVMSNLPDWFYSIAPVGDYYIQLFASYNQGCVYLPKITSVYRIESIGSWSQSLNIDKAILDRKSRLVCNNLMIDQFKLTSSELSSFKKRQCIYFKDLSLLHLKNKNIQEFIYNMMIGFSKEPIYYLLLIMKTIRSKLIK
ncbi:glycosyltransferase [Xenorhabdus stockiae]|uniref:glycosyltransferase n=1 Tax=Xenorhabdus stockiae TaxID=351614 RepID=UPI003CE85403